MAKYINEFAKRCIQDAIDNGDFEACEYTIKRGTAIRIDRVVVVFDGNGVYITLDDTVDQTYMILWNMDIGNPLVHNYYVGTFEPIEKCDLLIGESTYGDREDIKTRLKERLGDLDKLKSIIDTQVVEMKGRVVIPVFAQSRCPNILTMIYELYKDSDFGYRVYVDSPLALKLLKDYGNILDGDEKEEFDKVMAWDRLGLIDDAKDSKALVESNEPCVGSEQA